MRPLTVLLVSASLAGRAAAQQPPPIERVSLNSWGQEIYTCADDTGPCKNNSHPGMDAFGLIVAWETDGYQVVPEASNRVNTVHIYARDLASGTIQLVSQSSAGVPANLDSHFVVLSGDGRMAAFSSAATNLDPDDKTTTTDVFLRDLVLQKTWRVTELPGGGNFDGLSSAVRISFEGHAVSFTSEAKNLAPVVPGYLVLPTPSGAGDIYVAELDRRTFEWISVGAHGTLPDGPSLTSSMSYDAHLVAFASHATNHLPTVDPNADVCDVLLRDRAQRVTIPVSVALDGTLSGDGHSVRPMVSGLGDFVVFESAATNLVPGDTNGVQDVFVRDLVAGTTVRLSVSDAGAEADGDCVYPAISADGRFVVYSSLATNLTRGVAGSGALQFLAHDRDADDDLVFDEPGAVHTWILSSSASGEAGDGNSGFAAALSADGRSVPFLSEAANLVPDDLNGNALPNCAPTCRSGRDIFVRRY